jgi:hypothetical protein
MTVDDRYVLDMGDLTTVRLECVACDAAVSILVPKFRDPPDHCPSCGVPWFKGRSVEDMAVRQFVGNIREMATLPERAQVRVRLELAGSPSAGKVSTGKGGQVTR